MKVVITPQKLKNYYQDHRLQVKVFALLLLLFLLFLLLYATVGTSIPLFIAASSKVGLGFGFLTTISTPAASFISALSIIGLTYAVVEACLLLKAVFKNLGSCLFKRKAPALVPDTIGDDEERSTRHHSTTRMLSRMSSTANLETLESIHEGEADHPHDGSLKPDTIVNLIPNDQIFSTEEGTINAVGFA